MGNPSAGRKLPDLRLVDRGLRAEVEAGQVAHIRKARQPEGHVDAPLVAARDLLGQEPSQAAAQRLYEIKVDVSSHSFKEVLEDVYDRFPEFASKSVFRRAS